MNEGNDAVIEGERDVEVKDLHAELEQAVADAGQFILQCATDYEVRHCLWAGQDDDGRKHAANLNAPVFPWEGSSDTRIRLADEIVNDGVKLKMAATKRAVMSGGPVESSDTVTSSAVTTFMKWLAASRMQGNQRRELPLLANWMDAYGLSVLAVTWDEEQRVNRRVVSLAELTAGVAAQGAEIMALREQGTEVLAQAEEDFRRAAMMLQALNDPNFDADSGAWLSELFAGLKPGMARRAAAALRTKGECVVPEFKVVRSQPLWTACQVFRDIFFPANTTDLQRAPWIAWRESLTPVELKGRMVTEDYDAEVVEECEVHEGLSVLDTVRMVRADKVLIDDMTGRVEIFTFYRRVVDEDGFTTIVGTVTCPGVDRPLVEFELDEVYADYPFVDFCWNRTERVLLQNRSVPTLAESSQAEIKMQRDFRSDRTSLTILPPVKVPMSRANDKLELGPAVRVPERRAGEIEFMRMPTFDPDSVGLEERVRRDVNDYFARAVDGVSPIRQQMYAQADTDNWLGGLALAWRMTLRLAMAYIPQEFERVTGEAPPEGVEFDVLLDFNAADLNVDYVLKKLDVIQKGILPMDTMGVVDRVGLVEWSMRSVDPTLSRQVVRKADVAANSEIEDETMQFTKIAAGVEPEMKEGQNYALRAQVLEQILQKNPQLTQRYQSDEVFRGMVEARLKHFNFQVQQGQNAQIGRLGAMPALG